MEVTIKLIDTDDGLQYSVQNNAEEALKNGEDLDESLALYYGVVVECVLNGDLQETEQYVSDKIEKLVLERMEEGDESAE